NIVGDIDPFDKHAGNQVGARQIQLGNVGEAGFAADGLTAPRHWAHVGKPDVSQQRPVTRQQSNANRQQAFEPKATKDQPGEQVAQGDAIEHAHQPDVGPVVAESAVIKNTQDE